MFCPTRIDTVCGPLFGWRLPSTYTAPTVQPGWFAIVIEWARFARHGTMKPIIAVPSAS
jgi:hypothetical protein